MPLCFLLLYFFFNDTATTEIYTLSLHDALPIWGVRRVPIALVERDVAIEGLRTRTHVGASVVALYDRRSEEHTSELQSPVHLVCRLLLEKKKKLANGRTVQKPEA